MTKMQAAGSILMRAGGRRGFIVVTISINLMVWIAVAFGVWQRGWGGIDAPTIMVLLLSALVLLRCVRPGIELTPSGISVRQVFRVRGILWSEIRSIEVGKVLGMRQVSLLLENGETVKLPAPGDWWPATDRNFDGKLELLRTWWGKYRVSQ
jgi:hypothetical protein